MRQTPERLRELYKLLQSKVHLKSIVMTLAVLVVFVTTYVLILPAFTLDKEEAAEQGGIDVVAIEQQAETQAEEAIAEETTEQDVTDEAAESSEKKDADAAETKTEQADSKDVKADAKLLTEKTKLTADGGDFIISATVDEKAKVPADTSLEVKELDKKTEGFDYEKYCEKALKALQKDDSSVKDIKMIRFYDISLESDTQDESVEPDDTVSVKIAYEKGIKVNDADNIRIVHFGEKKIEVLDTQDNKVETEVNSKNQLAEASFETDGFSEYAVVEVETIEKTVITADGQEYRIAVKYDKNAGIPEGSELKVREITEEEEFNKYLQNAISVLSEEGEKAEISFARFFDIEIINNGNKVEPCSPVEVEIVNTTALHINDNESINVVHFASTGTEVIEDVLLNDGSTTLSYQQGSFSVTGEVVGSFSGNNWPSVSAGDYVLIVNSGNGAPYYAVDSNGGLVEVDYDSETGKVTFSDDVASTVDALNDYMWTYYVSGGNHRLTSVANTNNKIYPVQVGGGSAISNSTNSPGANQGYIYTRGNGNNRYCVAINSSGTSLESAKVTYNFGYTYPSNAAHFQFVSKSSLEEEITGAYGTAESIILTGNDKTLRMAEVTTEDEELIDFEGFTWRSSNSSIVTVSTDPDTDAPIAHGVSPGSARIIGTRTNAEGEIDEVVWTITVKDKTQNSIVFIHEPQDNATFANEDNIRPHEGYGETEPTNYVKFVVALADEDGNIVLYNGKPNVELPSGSVVPDRYEFELDSTGVFSIEEDTLSGISVPGYSYAGTYAYFGWYNNTDLENMAVVSEFKNLGRVSSRYSTYYSVLGFKTSRGNPQYQDYSQTQFGEAGYGYYAYNPTGVLMIVLQPVSEEIAYRTSYHNDYVPNGTARTNIVDTTRAIMIKGEWIPDEYRWDWYGETIMTTKTGEDLESPADGYEFVGWFDSVDAEGNGTGNEVIGQTEDGNYYAMKDGEKIIIRQNNDIYAKWQLVRGTLTVEKTIDGDLSSEETAALKEAISFTITDDTTSQVAKSITGSDMTWTDNIGSYDATGLSAATTYTVTESGSEVENYDLVTQITPNNGAGIKVSKTAAVKVSITNTYTKKTESFTVVKEESGTQEKLPNAGFNLYRPATSADSSTTTILVNGTETAVVKVDSITTDSNGQYDIEDLPLGVYYFVETNAPAGHLLLENPIGIRLGAGSIELLSSDHVSKSGMVLTIYNDTGVTLPNTGGIGTAIFYILGSMLVIGCGVVLISRRKLDTHK